MTTLYKASVIKKNLQGYYYSRWCRSHDIELKILNLRVFEYIRHNQKT